MPLRTWRLQLLGAAIAVAAAIVSAQSFASAREAVAMYLVQPGDTLSAISAATGVPLAHLVGMNSITNPDFILAGQTLSLDGSSRAATPAQTTTQGPLDSALAGPHYAVKTGDTLWDISLATGVSLDTLVKLNNLSNADQLSVGEVLQLPASAPIQRAAASAPPKPKATPAAKPTPAAAPVASPLQQRVAAEALRVGGPSVHVGAAAINLVSGEKITLHADDEFPSASVMKLPILVELERQISAGTLSWTESLRAEVGAMIAISDNSAANQIADAIHPQSVDDTMAHLGLSGTRFENLFSDARSPANPGMNETTPANMARLLNMIATDQIVNPQVSGDIRALLARNVDRSKLVRLLPPDARVAHKSGWYDGVANDVGIVTVDRASARWVIAVFSENLPDAETGNQIIATVSKTIYDAWAP